MKIEKHEKECRAIRLLPGNPKMETMKITNPLESHNWMQYQRQTADFFSELGCFAKVEAVVEGIRAKHKIDVWVKFQRYGIECKWVIECKYWNSRVSKEKVLALKSLVEDVGADRGLIISEQGFQSGAYDAARGTNIALITSLDNFKKTAKKDLDYFSIEQRTRNRLFPEMNPFTEIIQISSNSSFNEKLFSTWIQVTGGRKPTPDQVVDISSKILQETINLQSWEMRRILSNVVATALAMISHPKNLERNILALGEVATTTRDGRIFLATALSQIPRSVNIAEQLVYDLLAGDHPQIPWQLFRHFNFVGALLDKSGSIDSILARAEDDWIRHQLLATFCSLVTKDKSIYTRKYRSILDTLFHAEMTHNGDSYLLLLHKCQLAKYNTSIFSSLLRYHMQEDTEVIRQVLQKQFSDQLEEETIATISPSELCLYFDLLSLNLDDEKMSRDLKSVQGRYGAIVDSIQAILCSVSTTSLEEKISSLLKCHNEGIRWAIAFLSPSLYTLDQRIHHAVISKLLEDRHPWVLRETIEALSRTNDLRDTSQMESYIISALETVKNLEATRSPVADEVKKALIRFLAVAPRYVEIVSVGPLPVKVNG